MATHLHITEHHTAHAEDVPVKRRSLRVVLHTLIEGVEQKFAAREVLCTLPPTRDIDLATRVADNPAVIHTVGVGELDKRGQLILFNVDELAQQLKFIPLHIDDEFTLFLPSEPSDRHVLRFALAPYWRAMHGRGRADASEFMQLCFVSSKSPKQAKLDEGRTFRSWSKRNAKPFSKDELFSRFPFPLSRWSNFRVLKGELELCTPKLTTSTANTDERPTAAADAEHASDTCSIQNSTHLDAVAQPPAEQTELSLDRSDEPSVTVRSRDEIERAFHPNKAPGTVHLSTSLEAEELHSTDASLEKGTATQRAFKQLIQSPHFNQASAIWHEGITLLQERDQPAAVPPTWKTMCAHIAIRLADSPLAEEQNQDFTARFLRQANDYEPGRLIEQFTHFIAKVSSTEINDEKSASEVEALAILALEGCS